MKRTRLGIVCLSAFSFLAICLSAGNASATPPGFQTMGPLPSGVPGLLYGTTFETTGDQGPFTFAVTSGSLPAGLNLNSSTGHISGTPTTAGASNFNVTITDALEATAVGSFSITIAALPASTPAQLALLSGHYAFLLRGSEDGSTSLSDAAGSLNFDGLGNVTLLFDENGGGIGSGVNTQCSQTGTYTVDPNNRGLITFPGGGSCVTGGSGGGGGAVLAMSLGDVKNGVANTGRIVEFDDNTGNNSLGAGEFRRQDPASFTSASLAGTYVFGLTGQDSQFGRVLQLILATFNGSLALTAGSFDINDDGTFINGTLTGSYTAPDANGRSVLTATLPGLGTFTSALYIVSANHMYFLSLDPATTNVLLAGHAERQFVPGSFDLTSLSGPDVLTAAGPSGSATSAIVGLATASVTGGVGNFSFTSDVNDGGNLQTGQVLTGTYTMAPSGRSVITPGGENPALIAYFVRPDRAFFFSQEVDPAFGEIQPQIGAPFSASPLANNFFVGQRELVLSGNSDFSGIVMLASPNTLNVVIDESSSGGDLAFGDTHSVNYTVDSTGHIQLVDSDVTALSGYVISSFDVAFFDRTSSGPGAGNSKHPILTILRSIPIPPGAPVPASASVNFAAPVVVGLSAQSAPMTETNKGAGPLTIQSVTNAADFTASGSCLAALPVLLDLGQPCQIVVTFAPGANTLTNTQLAETITIVTDAGNITLNITGTAIAPGISFSPGSAVNFNNVPLGTNATRTVTVTNSGAVALNVTAVAIGGANPGDFSIALPNVPGQVSCAPPFGANIAPNKQCVLIIVFNPAAAGARSATITLTDNSPIAGSTQTISVQGNGTVPAISLSASSVSFTGVALNSTSPPQIITLTNTGLAPLTITNVSLGGANPGNFALASGTTCIAAAVIQPAGTCTVSVTFTPNSATAFNAAVNITSTASNGAQTIVLTGSAATISLVPAPGTATTVTVNPGDTIIFPLVLNSGGFTGTVTLGCISQQPTITCSVIPLTVQVNANQPVQTAISVQTFCSWTAPPNRMPSLPAVPPVELLALALLGITSIVSAISTKRGRRLGFALAMLAMVAFIGVGCSSGPQGPGGRTPAGTYTLTITATAQGVTQNMNVTLKVL